MKTINLEKPKASKRLIDLVEKIPELKIECNRVGTNGKNSEWLYDITTGFIQFDSNIDYDQLRLRYEYDENPLINKELLLNAIKNDINYITQNQFCDVLEQHLHLKAKSKMEELLPQIQEWYPDAYLEDFKGESSFSVYSGEEILGCTIVFCENGNLTVNNNHDKIWEDKYNLIVKKNNKMPEIKRGYAIDFKDNVVYKILNKWGDYETYNETTHSKYLIHRSSSIRKIYDENNNLIWEEEKNNENN